MVADKIIRAFDPIIQLMQGVAYPIAFIMVATGILMVIAGQQHRGMKIIRSAAMGYLLMQLLPAMMLLLRDIGKAMVSQ